ncbi:MULTISPECIES: hypothetical protein [unclassified Microcoleus]|uniref:hypothetical protein n=1 Tax=unclassified Microcoleus TaxID=2642155 RepID=UPI002FD4AD7B
MPVPQRVNFLVGSRGGHPAVSKRLIDIGAISYIEPRRRVRRSRSRRVGREEIKVSEGLKLRLRYRFDFTAIFSNSGANQKSEFKN